MTSIDNVTDITPRRQYVASAAQTAFDYPFPIFTDADLLIDVDGTTQALTTDYTVSGAGADTGGTVTFLSAMSGGEVVTIYRDTAIERTTDFRQNGPWTAASTNDQLDKLTVICQELGAKIKRCIRWPFTAAQTDAGLELSPLSNWYGKMLRISSTGVLEAADIISSVVALSADVIGQLIHPRTAAEIAAGITPTYYWYMAGDVRRYGGDIQTAINANPLGYVWLPAGTYALGATGLVLPTTGCRIEGASRNGAIITYTGTGTAIDGFTNGASYLALGHFTLHCSDDAANGFSFGNSCRQILLDDIFVQGSGAAGNTGAAFLLSSGNGFSGNLSANLIYGLGFKYGVKCVGVVSGSNTWTSMSFTQCWLAGRSAGIIAGSAGIWFDANTNGVGSSFIGGSVESFDVGLRVDDGSYGLDFAADNEGNNTAYTVGNTFVGRIKLFNSTGNGQEASRNGTSQTWWQCRQLLGEVEEENYYDRKFLLYDDSSASATFGIYRGSKTKSFISGTANPTLKAGFVLGVEADAAGVRNYMTVCGHRLGWDSSAPASGTWGQGDVMWNTGAAAGGAPGWVCTAGGTPGTWKAMANVAA